MTPWPTANTATLTAVGKAGDDWRVRRDACNVHLREHIPMGVDNDVTDFLFY